MKGLFLLFLICYKSFLHIQVFKILDSSMCVNVNDVNHVNEFRVGSAMVKKDLKDKESSTVLSADLITRL